MAPKWNCENISISTTWNLIILLLVIFVTIKGDSPKNLITPPSVLIENVPENNVIPQQQQPLPPFKDEVKKNNNKIATENTLKTASSSRSKGKILSRKRRYLVFPAGSSLQMGMMYLQYFYILNLI